VNVIWTETENETESESVALLSMDFCLCRESISFLSKGRESRILRDLFLVHLVHAHDLYPDLALFLGLALLWQLYVPRFRACFHRREHAHESVIVSAEAIAWETEAERRQYARGRVSP
jgi:hypothetical protein